MRPASWSRSFDLQFFETVSALCALLASDFFKAYAAGLGLADQYQSGPPRRLDPPLGPGLDPPLAQAPRCTGARWGGGVSSPGARRAAASFTSAQACCAPFGILRIVLPELPVSVLLAALRSIGPKKASM